jgi:hypothetical protein
MCQVFSGQDPHLYASTTRRLRLNGQSTSIRLENYFWQVLDIISLNSDTTTLYFEAAFRSAGTAWRAREFYLVAALCLPEIHGSLPSSAISGHSGGIATSS